MAMYYTKFKVIGRRQFPLDMLRYDSAFPYDSAAAHSIADADNPEPRDVWLGAYHPVKGVVPTAARWRSFGWSVDASTIETHRV